MRQVEPVIKYQDNDEESQSVHLRFAPVEDEMEFEFALVGIHVVWGD